MDNHQPAAIRRDIPREAYRKLQKLNPLRATLGLTATWIALILLMSVAYFSQSYWVYFICALFIAGRQHALLVLFHDASHHLLYKKPKVNDVLANLLLAFPLFMSIRLYRHHHHQHHIHTNTENDPDILDATPPASRKALYLLLLMDFTGINGLKSLRSINTFGVTQLFVRNPLHKAERRLFLLFIATLIGLLSFFHLFRFYLLYWVIPMWFFLPALLRMRSLGEHAGRRGQSALFFARSIQVNLLERALIAPLNINLHLEHHIFPNIPFYNLQKLSRLLLRDKQFSDHMVINTGYFFGHRSVLHEIYH